MADATTPPPSEKTPDFRITVEQGTAGLVDAGFFTQAADWAVSTFTKLFGKLVEWTLIAGAKLGGTLAQAIAKGEDGAQEAFGDLAQVAIADMFGVGSDKGSMTGRGKRAARQGVAVDIGDMLLRAFAGQADTNGGGPMEPSDQPAKNFLAAMAQLALEGWLEGWIVEACTLGQLETFGDLDDTISHVLGLGRAAASVHGPIVKHMIVTPLEWKIQKAHRPNLLSAAEVARQWKRGRWSQERSIEELARQGWSDDRIEALFNAAAKFHTVSDLHTMINAGLFDRAGALRHLADAGYEPAIAENELDVERIKDIGAFEQQLGSAAVDAYAAGRISAAQLNDFTQSTALGEAWGARMRELAGARKLLRRKTLTPAEARECVKAGVLAVADYRAALEGDGYVPEAVIALELKLRAELDEKKAVEDHRRELELERAAEKEARRVAAEKRRLEVEAERAQQRRGPFASLARAAARGLIPFSRVEEVLAPDYDADTVAILLSLVEDDRQTYLEQQQRAEDARQRAARREISIADLEQAVLSGVLTVAEYRAGLVARKVDAGDVDILAATLAATLEDRLRAQQAHEDADAAAKDRSIDLGRYEQLVRRGVRTLPQYDALLASLGFGEAARADMDELLRLKIADDQTASALRAGAGAVDATTGWTVNEWRRAVLLQLRTVDQFGTALLAFDFTSDEQQLLIAELRDDVTAADAARARREQLAQPVEGRALSLSTVARAARLGIVTPATYQRRLEAAGYSADDIAIELDLLVTEIADVQAARALRDATPAPAGDKDLSLADLARAVRRGLRSLEDYRARALQLELTPAAADTLVRVLADELRATDASKARRKEIDTELSGRNLSLAELENKVRAGDWTVAQFMDALEETGYERPDAELLGGLLARELDDAAATP